MKRTSYNKLKYAIRLELLFINKYEIKKREMKIRNENKNIKTANSELSSFKRIGYR